MKENKPQVQIRISKNYNEKLMAMARSKSLTKTEFLSQMVDYLYRHKIDIDATPLSEQYATILRMLTSLNSAVIKTTGSTERTESFIRSLVSDSRQVSGIPTPFSEGNIEEYRSTEGDDRLPRAIAIIEQLFSQATKATSFDAKPIMQIRIADTEFKRLKSEYEQLCM